MIDILKTVTPSAEQWEITIEGMHNSFDGLDKSDSFFCGKGYYCQQCELEEDCLRNGRRGNLDFTLGRHDLNFMLKLAESGSSHSKFCRMLPVWVTINAPLYWWKEMDTYKIGTVCSSCSTMHKIAEKKFSLDDFSHDHLFDFGDIKRGDISPKSALMNTIGALNQQRERYLKSKSKDVWWQLIQLLPSSYNQRRTVMLNYEVLAKIFAERRDHKLDEWQKFCEWIKTLPYSEIITGGEYAKNTDDDGNSGG